MEDNKKRVTIYFRDGGLITSETTRKGDDIATIAQRMGAGGCMVCEDALWSQARQVAVNLGDVSVVILVSQG